MAHHPCHLAHPNWSSPRIDFDCDQAAAMGEPISQIGAPIVFTTENIAVWDWLEAHQLDSPCCDRPVKRASVTAARCLSSQYERRLVG